MPTPDLDTAHAEGLAAARLATRRAEGEAPSFSSRTEAAILARLASGPASGEDLTDHVRASGVVVADGRAFGSIFSSLNRRGLIRVAGHCLRRYGHSTAGGRIWELC